MNIQTTHEQVRKILSRFPDATDSNGKLFLYWNLVYGTDKTLCGALATIPFETLTRCRRRLKAEFPTSNQTNVKRKEAEAAFMDYARAGRDTL